MADDPNSVLSGFLTETTRRVRRTLLALTTVAIGTKVFGVHLKTLVLLGNTITIENDRWLAGGLFVVLFYFWGLFLVYALGDAQRARVSIWDIYRMAARLTPDASLQHRDNRSASVVLSVRVFVDVFVPMLYGGAGLLVLVPMP